MTKPDLASLIKRVERLENEVVELREAADLPPALPAWVDEPMFDGDWTKLPCFSDITVRCAGVLFNSRVRSVRGLITTPHREALKWKNFGKVSLTELVTALANRGVKWPPGGLK